MRGVAGRREAQRGVVPSAGGWDVAKWTLNEATHCDRLGSQTSRDLISAKGVCGNALSL